MERYYQPEIETASRNPSGREPGMRGTFVKFIQMKEWLAEHDNEIDWYEKLAI